LTGEEEAIKKGEKKARLFTGGGKKRKSIALT